MTESDPGRTCLSTLRENGIDWNRPPERLDAATLFAPAGEMVPRAPQLKIPSQRLTSFPRRALGRLPLQHEV